MSTNRPRRFSPAMNILLCVCCLLMNCASDTSPRQAAQSDNQGIEAPYVRSDLIFLTATELAAKIRSKEVTSLEVVKAHLAQIKRYNPRLNAVVTLDEKGALDRAAEADEALAKGIVWGPLHGVPITVKDDFATAGMLTTNSHPPLSNYIPEKDAFVIGRLRNAGAIILGKTNMPELATDVQTSSPIFGATNNPWDISRTPGGSSGGSAAAVAAGLIPLDFGNDYGGSIRIPSHFCGVYGLKPTDSLVSNEGVFPGVPWGEERTIRHFLSCGPIARSIDDLWLSLNIIAGPDHENDDVGRSAQSIRSGPSLQDIRAAWTDDIQGVPLTAEYKAAIRSFVSELERSGCHVERAVPSNFHFQSAWQTYGEISDMELNAHMPSYLRLIMYIGGACERKDIPFVKMAFPMTYEKYLTALNRRDMLINDMDSFMAEWDVWLCPVSSTPAYKSMRPLFHFENFPVYTEPVLVDDQPVNIWVANASYTTLFNFTGNPVVTMPIGLTQDGLPMGIQVVGRRFHDWELLSISKKLSEAAARYERPPGY